IDFDNINISNNWTVNETSTGTYEIQNIILPNANPDETVNVSYTITASGAGLCGEGQVFGTIDRNPAPIIQVSNLGSDAFCNPQDINSVLEANWQGSGFDQNDIEWYYNGNLLTSGTTLD